MRNISYVYTLLGCTVAQFTCANGQCVPISARCNNVNECSDGSDEQNCGKFKEIAYVICNLAFYFMIRFSI